MFEDGVTFKVCGLKIGTKQEFLANKAGYSEQSLKSLCVWIYIYIYIYINIYTSESKVGIKKELKNIFMQVVVGSNIKKLNKM